MAVFVSSLFHRWIFALPQALRHLTGKCMCALVRAKGSEFFQPYQFGVACPIGAEKVAHGLRACTEERWMEENFTVLKVDMKNAFNMVSCQALLSECAKNFPELYPWAHWCYSQHPFLWHTMGNLTPECGVQQGDPLGPLLAPSWPPLGPLLAPSCSPWC